jgi:hypothetical protein
MADGRPELLLGTVIDISVQKKAEGALGSYRNAAESPASRPYYGENSEMTAVSQQLTILLQRVSQTLQPGNIPRMGRPEIKEFLLHLEEIKMLVSQLEVLRLFQK